MSESYVEWAARLFDPILLHAKPEALRGIRALDISVIIALALSFSQETSPTLYVREALNGRPSEARGDAEDAL